MPRVEASSNLTTISNKSMQSTIRTCNRWLILWIIFICCSSQNKPFYILLSNDFYNPFLNIFTVGWIQTFHIMNSIFPYHSIVERWHISYQNPYHPCTWLNTNWRQHQPLNSSIQLLPQLAILLTRASLCWEKVRSLYSNCIY